MTPVVILGGVGAAPSEYWAHDGFQPPADTSLHLHTPEVTPDGAWGDYASNSQYTALASGGHAGAVFGYHALFRTVVPSADYEVGMIWNSGGNVSSSGGPLVSARQATLLASGNVLQAATTTYYARLAPDASQLELRRSDGSSVNTVGSANKAVTISASVDHEIILRVEGTTLTVLFDGTVEMTETDANLTAAGYAGMAMRDRASWTYKQWWVKLL